MAAVKHYLVLRKNEQFVVEVPEEWKVTYGPLAPGSMMHHGNEGWVLRFYETKEKQRAVFCGVTEFRDLSIPITIYGKGEHIGKVIQGDPNQGGAVAFALAPAISDEPGADALF